MRYAINLKNAEMPQFYRYEGKVATMPISNRRHGKLVDIGCGSKPYINYFTHYIGISFIGHQIRLR